MKKIIIVGAGGHAKVVADAVLFGDEFEIIGFADDNLAIGTTVMSDYKVISTIEYLPNFKNKTDFLALGIGNIPTREKIVQKFSSLFQWTSVIHPSATIAMNAKVENGATVLANTVISSEAEIGAFSIIDAGVIVDHECEIGEFSHLSIGTLVGSNSVVSNHFKTEVGQIIPPFSKI